MILKFNEKEWEKFDPVNSKGNIDFSDDGNFVKINDQNLYATLKKVMHTEEIENNKTYTVSVLYEIKNIKQDLMLYGMISLYDAEGKCTRRQYFDRVSEGKLEKVFKSENETKVRIELGLKSYGDIVFYAPEFKEEGEVKSKKVKLCAVHLYRGKTYEINLKRIGEGFDKAADAGADIVCFAETMNDRGTKLTLDEKFEPIDGVFCNFMRKKCKERNMFAFFTFHELDKYGARRNTAVLINRQGEIVGTYSKSHLTIIEYEYGMVPGNEYTVFDTEIGKIGMLICWDSFFPETSRAMALSGAEIILVSTAGNPTHRFISFAKENGVYVVVACCSTSDAEGYAPTKIIAPNGNVISQQREDMGLAFADVDLYDESNRNVFGISVGPSWGEPNNIYLNEYRPDLYGQILPEQ